MEKVGVLTELSLLLSLDADSKMPLHRQIYQQIRDAILAGKLRSRVRLPASRQLAKTLGLSRTTIVQSYDQLVSEGYLQSKAGAGTFVCSQLPDDLLLIRRSTASSIGSLNPSNSTLGKANKIPIGLSVYGDRLSQTADYDPGADCPLSFRYGLPDLSLFPVRQWRRLLNRHAAASADWMEYGGEPMGYEPLRQEVAQYVSEVRAVRCVPEQILIMNGTQQALSLAVQILLDVGDAIALENPGYLSARRIFTAQGATVVPVPVDSEGMKVDEPGGLAEVATAMPKPKLIYVTPSHQFPTGVLMSFSRRLALLNWARENDALIIEDDYDSEFRYSGRPIPALQGLDEHNRVLYVGTFSKVMFPGLRLGYAVIPPPLIEVFRRAKWLCDRQCLLIDQMALAEFIQTGQLAQHVRRMRSVYESRRRSLIGSLQAATDSVTIPGDASGLHILARFHSLGHQKNCKTGHSDLLPERELISQARKAGVGLFSAKPHYLPANCCDVDRASAGSYGFEGDESKTLKAELVFGFGGICQAGIRSAIAKIQPFLST